MLKDLNDEQIINLAFVGRCVKGVGHNINTPLSAIVGRSEMLLMRFNRIKDKLGPNIDGEELDKCLRDISLILDNSNRVAGTIKNVMQKSINAESNQLQSINIGGLLQAELEFLQADMDFKHNIEKTYHIDKNIPTINGLYVHFSNSFLEILENCKTAMLNSDEKKLTVAVAKVDNCIEVGFHDTGCGIEAEKIDQLMKILKDPSPASPEVAAGGSGTYRVAKLLKAYSVRYDIKSRPGDTMFKLIFPTRK